MPTVIQLCIIGGLNKFVHSRLNTIHSNFYLSEQQKISKSFKGTKISDIISNILTNTLKVKPSKILEGLIFDNLSIYLGLVSLYR